MKTKPRGSLVRVIGAVLLVAGGALAAPETLKDQALKALRSGDFPETVRLCQAALRGAPGDEEILFLMSRAYAYNENYDWALETLESLIRRSPDNTDYLLLRARIEYWRGDLRAAAAGFDEVLRISPRNPEGRAGLGWLALRDGDDRVAEQHFRESLALDPDVPEVLYGLGLALQRRGEYEKAEESFRAARRLDPKNADFKKALTRLLGRTDAKHELRLIYQPETFSDGRTPFQSGQAAFMWRLPKNGPSLVFKWDRTRRYGLQDDQYGLEAYPRLWKGGSAYLDLNVSPGGASLYPKAAYLAEIYQALSGSWDASVGYRFMDFESNPVSIVFGSLGVYAGPFYSCLRVYYSPKSRESKISWLLLTRWYFTDRNFLYAGYGQGSRSMEIIATGDLDFYDVHTMMAGLNVTLFRHIHLIGSFTRLNDRNVDRNTWTVGLGYKWGR